jgi:hypothetical protein
LDPINIPVLIALTKQDQTTDVMVRRGNETVEGKYDLPVLLNLLLNGEETTRGNK